ncbi:MAG TPA: hypothetical protein VGK73_25800, partial [Polyangiaceae bacterium]
MCPMGTDTCPGSCTTLASDPANCGFCGNRCMGGTACTNGTCGCPTGSQVCGGMCVNTLTDSRYCGSCNTQCQTGYACTNGTCTPDTSAGG